jgi:hypothetical protein
MIKTLAVPNEVILGSVNMCINKQKKELKLKKNNK